MKKYVLSIILLIVGIISLNTNKVNENVVNLSQKQAGPTGVVSNLTIKNVQNTSDAITYTYNIKLDGLQGSYRYTLNGVESYMVLNAVGSSSIEVNSNQTLIIYDIPVNTTYTIEQNRPANYKTIVDNVETTMAQGTTVNGSTITFNNETTVVDSNPVTSDKINIVAIILFLAAATSIVLKNIKVKRYE